MCVLIESPFTVGCDSFENYKTAEAAEQPGLDFRKGLNTIWDETHGLASAVGQYVVEARRHQRTCYLAAIADGSGREMAVPLSFLGKGRWKMTLWQHASDSTAHPEHIVASDCDIREPCWFK
jgi:alpha-glucosidase